ncbi:hypothetical protein [Epibacterium ulvae]|uniref:hypothetical protein n=1 Tax=Epibacterium ulvae TaxID=1156985 RepID=UPI002492A658|nr:hypothetical protein [Epibacterium ulvae]
MTVSSFENRLNGIHWVPTAAPSKMMVDQVIAARETRKPLTELSLLGALLGCLIGFAFKGFWILGTAVFQNDLDQLFSMLSLAAVVASVVLAIVNIFRQKRVPSWAGFSTINLVMVAIITLS